MSVHANRRADEYGGSAENRSRFLAETLAAIRKVWPQNRPLTARFSVVGFDGRDEQTLAEAIAAAGRFTAEGLDVQHRLLDPCCQNPVGTGLRGSFAERVRRETGLPVSTSWLIRDPEPAESLVRHGMVDVVMLGRPLLAPHLPYATARALGLEKAAWAPLPAPYAHWLDRYRA